MPIKVYSRGHSMELKWSLEHSKSLESSSDMTVRKLVNQPKIAETPVP